MNKSYSVFAFAVCAAWNVSASTATSLNGLWKFSKEEKNAAFDAAPVAFDDASWQTVEVPHDWAISGPFDPEADGNTGQLPWRGTGWYRKTVNLTAADIQAVRAGGVLDLEFDGVMACPKVYVNGSLAGSWDYGYMSFRVDATPFVREGANVIAVHADTTHHHSRWYPGAGIYRSVRLVRAPAVHVAMDSLFVSTPAISRESATVRVAFSIANRLDKPIAAKADVQICDAKGRTVLTMEVAPQTVAAKGDTPVVLEGEVRNPKLWDVDDPQLHTARVVVHAEGRDDAQTVRFGIRQSTFTADDGFHLNGRRVQIQGVDLHSDMGPLGMAFNRSVMKRQLEIMKDMGANALRTSHNACDPQVLELCDELGIVVWNECFDKWGGTSGRRNDQNLEEYVCRNLRQFARRDRNHPSVVVWSIGNEILPNGCDLSGRNQKTQDGMSAARFRQFRAAIREFDTTRPVGIGCCHTAAVDTGMFAELDISGWNYKAQYRKVKSRHPEKPVLYTESASALSSYGSFEQPPAANKTDYDVAHREVGAYEHNAAPWSDIPDVEFARMEKDRYCGGEFVWTGIDYLGEPTPYVHAKIFPMMNVLKRSELARSSYFGIADLTGIPKERYFLYRAHWNKKAHTIHISPHWNWAGREGQKTPVYVYTDGNEAELFLNGRSLGRRAKGVVEKPANIASSTCGDAFRTNSYYDVCARYRLRWFDVPYEPGELKAVAYTGGMKIGEATMKTAGEPVAVRLTAEKPDLPADGETCVFVQVDVVDAQGVRDPWAKNCVKFTLTGPGRIMAVGNGDPRGHEVFTDVSSHKLYFGKAIAVVRRDKDATAPIVLTATVDGLKDAHVEFK